MQRRSFLRAMAAMAAGGAGAHAAAGETKAHFEWMLGEGGWSGAQLAVCRRGKLVLDLHGGVDANGKAVAADSLICILSATKALTAMVVHTLHDRRVFQYDDRVAKYWPQFATRGKEAITIRQVLSHRAGLAPDLYSGYAHWREWSKPGGVRGLIAGMSPSWEPGTANGYHALTYGQVLDELIQVWTGKNTGEWLRAEIAGPLGIGDVYIGLPAEELPRVAALRTRQQAPPPDPPPGGENGFFQSPLMLGLCLAWGSGTGTARSLAKLMNVYAGEGAYREKRFFTPETFRQAVHPTNGPEDIDRILRSRVRWGLGVHAGRTQGTAAAPGILFGGRASQRACGHIGGNSTVLWADAEAEMTMAIVTTGAPPVARYQPLADKAREEFGG